MKTLMLATITLLFSMSSQSQNKNVQETTKTTVTTVTTSEGDKKYTTKENVKEVQNIEMNKEKANTLNIDAKNSPVMVTTTTKVINPDGTVRNTDVNRSSYYLSNGTKYQLVQDDLGYYLVYGSKKPAVLRKTSTNNYFYKSGNKTAIGYFNTDGNLVIETYDNKTDKMITETYVVVKE